MNARFDEVRGIMIFSSLCNKASGNHQASNVIEYVGGVNTVCSLQCKRRLGEGEEQTV